MSTPKTAHLLTLFGATGDLALRMLWPSLYSLEAEGLLIPQLRLLGTARAKLGRDEFIAQVSAALVERIAANEMKDDVREKLFARIDYHPAGIDDDVSMAALAQKITQLRGDGDVLYHLSTAPRFYVPACEALAKHGAVGPWARVMLEKPIGEDTASAEAINDGV